MIHCNKKFISKEKNSKKNSFYRAIVLSKNRFGYDQIPLTAL
jgi:hypothetical protein